MMIHTFKKGHRLTAAEMNEIVRGQQKNVVSAGFGMRVKATPYGKVLEVDKAKLRPFQNTSSEFGLFMVWPTDETETIDSGWDQDDYIIGAKVDDAGESVSPVDRVKIAKPWELRRSSYDGKAFRHPILGFIDYEYSESYEREARIGTDRETQTVVPFYSVGTLLVAMKATAKLTGDKNIEWLDTTPRQWAQLA